jgi:O-antigen ligase
VCLSWALLARSALWKVASAFSLALLLFALLKTDSRNAIYAVMLVAIIALFINLKLKNVANVVYIATAILVGAFLMVMAKPQFIEKQLNYSAVSGTIVDEARLRIWNGAMLAAQERPFLGYGVGMFGLANSSENLKSILRNSNRDFNEGDFVFTDHAHNLSINWLLERGILAILLLYFWMAVTLRYFAKNLTSVEEDHFWKLCGIFSVTTAFFCGLGNTSWHHEHGLLAAILIGLSVSHIFRLRYSRPPARD